MDNGGLSLIVLFILAAGAGGAIMAISALIGGGEPPPERKLPYECGIDPIDVPRHRFSSKFFLIAVLFIIFDVEVVFLYPWAITFKEVVKTVGGNFALIEVSVFLVILAVALVYAWGRGALKWEE